MNYDLSIINFAYSHRQQAEVSKKIGMKGKRKDSTQDLSSSIVKLSRAKDVFYWHERQGKSFTPPPPFGRTKRSFLNGSRIDGS